MDHLSYETSLRRAFIVLAICFSSIPTSVRGECDNELALFSPAKQREPFYPVVIGIVSGEDDHGYKPTWIKKKSYRARRHSIRLTWKMHAKMFGIPAFFVLSDYKLTAQDREESTDFGDVLLLADPQGEAWGYKGLSAKTLSLMQFIARQCATVKYLVKCDDDTYVHVPRLSLLVNALPGRNHYVGKQHCRVPLNFQWPINGVNRSIFLEGQWAIPQYTNNTGLTEFPCYMQGGAYMVSGDVARALGRLAAAVPLQRYGGMEDMALGLWLSGWNLTTLDLGYWQMYIDVVNGLRGTWHMDRLCKNRWLFVHRVNCAAFGRSYTQLCHAGISWSSAQNDATAFQYLMQYIGLQPKSVVSS